MVENYSFWCVIKNLRGLKGFLEYFDGFLRGSGERLKANVMKKKGIRALKFNGLRKKKGSNEAVQSRKNCS
jgi:hypothetical protein